MAGNSLHSFCQLRLGFCKKPPTEGLAYHSTKQDTDHMAQIISIASVKGGVDKSVVAANLAI